MLFKLADKKPRPPPARYFPIDRVSRNETVDATHLCEFHQVEGVIADYGLTLGGLLEFMTIFFKKMNITNLKFKPAYNPYTERKQHPPPPPPLSPSLKLRSIADLQNSKHGNL